MCLLHTIWKVAWSIEFDVDIPKLAVAEQVRIDPETCKTCIRFRNPPTGPTQVPSEPAGLLRAST